MKHKHERTPDYIMITILLLYFIGYPLQSYLRDTAAAKPKTEESNTRSVPKQKTASTDK